MSWKNKLSYLISKMIYPVARFYWFVFRPKTYGVKVVILNKEKALLVRHAYGKMSWTFPGGKIEKGELPEQTACREMTEELDVKLENLNYLGIIYSTRQYKNDKIWCFTATIDNQSVKINEYELLEF